MDNQVKILGVDGNPIEHRPKISALNTVSGVPYDAADVSGDQLANWRPYLGSPDTEINGYRDRVVSRMRDLVRNDGWASGSVTRLLDNAVGAIYRPLVKPDYKYLAQVSGNKAFDAKWADEYGRVVEAHFRAWSNDEGRYCDLSRKQTVSQMLRLAFRHKLVDGDALAVLHYRQDRLGIGRAKYATTIQLIDPDRLSNPNNLMDTMNVRGGVEIDSDGAPCAYHIRKAHMADYFNAQESMTWERVPRETGWGRPVVVHDLDQDRADQHRGTGILMPIVQRMKMLIKYDQAELESSILNAIFGAYITSPYDHQMVEEALDPNSKSLGLYQDGRIAFHNDTRLSLVNGSRLPIFYPGEDIKTVSAARPHSNFKDFESTVLRNIAAALGLSTQQVTQDWSDVNYSSARAAMLEAWKTLTRRRDEFSIGFAQPIFSAFVEELHSYADLPLPKNAPHFLEAKTAYSRAKWMGPGRGWIDPVAEAKGAILRITSGLSTLEAEVAENAGEDWEETLDQIKREREALEARGIALPVFSDENEETVKTRGI